MTAHILFVEDDDELRELIARALHKAGYRVTQAADGGQAIELLTQASDERLSFDVMLTDIVMGEIDGTEVMKIARSQPEPPEVIVLTGNGTLQTAMEAVRAGAFDYILKPCMVPRLLARVSAAVERHRGTRSQPRSSEPALANGDSELPVAVDESLPADEPVLPVWPTDRYLVAGRLRIDTYRHEVWFEERLMHVTPTEYEILTCLAAVPGRVVAYHEIALRTHNVAMENAEAHDVLRHHVRNLRRKFERRYLVGVRRVGYMLDIHAAASDSDG